MEQNNRFSSLLKRLMTDAELKNYTLAQELQYDVSYISKWVSGRMLPAKKTSLKVLQGISHCIVSSASGENLEDLLENYQVRTCEELEQAIYDHLYITYNYTTEQKDNLSSETNTNVNYYPKLSIQQFSAKMHHPVLRQVKSLDIMAAIDIIEVSYGYRLQLIELEPDHISLQYHYPDVHFSMIVNLDVDKWDPIQDTMFLMSMISQSARVDFRLYGCDQVIGKIIFAVKNEFSISGMLAGREQCISVVTSEGKDDSNILYQYMQSLCRPENQLFRKTTIQQMLCEHVYVSSLLDQNQCWFLGHMTEHFLPEEMFEQLCEQCPALERTVGLEELRGIRRMTQRMLEYGNVSIMIYVSALSALTASDELDFYGYTIHLTARQRISYLRHLLMLWSKNEGLRLRLVFGRFDTSIQEVFRQCLFLSGNTSYLRMENGSDENCVMIVDHPQVQQIFERFNESLWGEDCPPVISKVEDIRDFIHHIMEGILLMEGDISDKNQV